MTPHTPCSFAPLGALLIASSLALSSGCAATAGRDLEQVPRRVAVVTTDIKAALIAAPEVSAAAIRVSLEDDAIVLEGFVDDAGERERASGVAAENGGGRPVDNRLEIR